MQKTIYKARKHARLYGAGAPPTEIPKRKTKLMAEFKEKQFELFFLDKDNVTMSSYRTDPKTNLPILYLCDNKASLWKKFQQNFPNGMKKTSFMGRLADCTQLKYRDDLGGLCGTCNNYGFGSFESLIGIARNIYFDKMELVTINIFFSFFFFFFFFKIFFFFFFFFFFIYFFFFFNFF